MTYESMDGKVCKHCGETLYRDTCPCETFKITRVEESFVPFFDLSKVVEFPTTDLVSLLRRSIDLATAKRREQEAYFCVKAAEENLRAANDFWESCCTDVRLLEEPN